MRFGDKVAIVTGGGSGIGRATVLRLASDGAAVVVADVDHDRARQVADEARAAGAPRAEAIACDVGDERSVIDAVADTCGRLGRLDVVVNNAGRMIFKSLADHTADDFLGTLKVDLLGAFFFTREAFRAMKRGGAIVNVSSIHAVETTPLVTAYAASKAALLSLTRSAAIEGKPLGLRVNAVMPGAIETPMLRTNPNVASGAERLDPAQVGRPEDVAAAIAFLASDDAAFVQGAVLQVDGGRLDRL